MAPRGDEPLPADSSSSVEEGGPPEKPHQNRTPRFIARNLPFHQSKNSVNVDHNQRFQVFLLLQHDWFHVLLRLPTWKSLLLLLSAWTGMLILFAGFYVWVDQRNSQSNCGLGIAGTPISFRGAFTFSLQTCTTVGYTLPNGINSFFEECPSLQVVIYFQMVWSMMSNAFLFAFFYARLANVNARGAQIVMGDKAIVSVEEGGQIRFQVRVCDIDGAVPVLESHVRLYAILHSQPVPRQLRVLQPNDELGGMVFLSVPTVVTHHVDVYSLLHPPADTPVRPGGLVLRTADAAISSREEIVCPICAESYGTYERWRSHVLLQRITEENGDYPIPGTHRSLEKSEFAPISEKTPPAASVLKEIETYFEREVSEVICVVEGIEPVSSGTFQALQSYCFEDIVFHPGARFSPCVKAVVGTGSNDGDALEVDLDRFHDIGIDKEAAEQARIHPRTPKQRSLRGHDSFMSGARTCSPHRSLGRKSI